MANEKSNLRGFENHGIIFEKYSGSEGVADCIFCGKRGKFYANTETRLWNCRSCGKSGNFAKFLATVLTTYKNQIKKLHFTELSGHRRLPTEAFKRWEIGHTGTHFAFPTRNEKGEVTDVRTFAAGKKIMSTSGCKTGMFGFPELLSDKDSPVYLCEGEWDAIAWKWLLEKRNKKGVVLGVPGASTFKNEWVPFFKGRTVRVLYDNDQPGIDGEIRVIECLSGTVKSLTFLHWGDAFEPGYDINDLVADVAVKEKKIKRVFKYVFNRLKPQPRSRAEMNPSGSKNPVFSGEADQNTLKPISIEKLFREYRKWLYMDNVDALKVMYGTIIANQIIGDPIWLFLVAPPGGSKSEFIMSLSESEKIHSLTSLTPHTLISGAHWSDGRDPSLLPALDGKILAIKDFTTILTMHYSVRDEIFGTLRDAYDGSIEKAFGNGITRTYDSKFGIIAGVTPVIETFNIMHSSLGERFLKFRITGNWDSGSEEHKIRQALSNINREDAMRDQLKRAAHRFIRNLKMPDTLPVLSDKYITRVVGLSKFAARLRGVVDRDKFTGQVMYKPSSEVGTRIAKQITKLGAGIAILLGKNKFDEGVYALMRRVILDTVPDRSEDVVRAMFAFASKNETCTTGDLVQITRLPQTTVFRILQDLVLLKVANRSGDKQVRWELSKNMKGLIEMGAIYVKPVK